MGKLRKFFNWYCRKGIRTMTEEEKDDWRPFQF